jgi:hypothetical protein
VPDGKNFLSMECAHRIRFSVCRLCETNRLFNALKQQKPLVRLGI